MLAIGILIGWFIAWGFATAFILDRRRSAVVLVDPWWLENEDRWASLRPIILAERASQFGSSEPPT